MVDIATARANVQEEEVKYRAAVSEGTWFKLGGAVNFINKRHYELKQWLLNGPYSEVVITGFDGIWPVPIDMDILFFSMSNVVGGASGTTEIDLLRLTSPGAAGTSIFSTTPKITSGAASNIYMIKDIAVPANDINPAGTTLPVFSVTSLDKGDALRTDFLQSMSGAETVAVQIMYRPR